MRSLGKFPDPFIAEIAGQPDALRRAAAMVRDDAGRLAAVAVRAAGGTLCFAGMGSSYDAAYPAVTDLAGRGHRVAMLDAAELLHFRLPMLHTDDVLVLVSQSGESAETVAVASAVRDRTSRPVMVAVTNVVASTLAGLADEVFDTRAGHEVGPSTMTFAASLVALAGLATAATRLDPDAFALAVEEAARSIEGLVADPALPDRLSAWHGGRAATVILGRGGARAAAEMGALTLKEAVGYPVESLQAAQFRHGPLELAGPGLAAAIIATEPETLDLERRLAAELATHGTAVLTIGPGEAGTGFDHIAIGAHGRLLAPAVAVVPLQVLSWRLAADAGRTPGTYVHATKVTTRE